MAKIQNKHVYGTPERIKEIKEESDWIGRNVSRIDRENPGHLIVFAIPPKKRSRPKTEETQEAGSPERKPRRSNGYSRYKEIGE